MPSPSRPRPSSSSAGSSSPAFCWPCWALAFQNALGTQFLYVAGAGYWSGVGEANIAGFNLWPPILAVALTGSPIVVLLIGIGYILNSFQIANNIMIGTTRIMVAASLDRAMPEWFSRVSERCHTPVNAHLAFFLASIPAILCYNTVPGWLALTLGVTFGGGLGFTGSALAGIFFPFKAKEVYAASPGAKYTVNSYVGMLFGVAGIFAWIWAAWVLAPHAFPASLFLITLVRTAVIVGGILFLSPLREQLPGWLKGEKMPWPTALGMLGGGLGMAMVLSFVLSPALGVIGNWDFTDFPTHLWSQILYLRDHHVLHRLVCADQALAEGQGHQYRLRLQGNPARVRSSVEFPSVSLRTGHCSKSIDDLDERPENSSTDDFEQKRLWH